MKTSSPVKLETYQVLGRNLKINFNEVVVESTAEDSEDTGTEHSYTYDTACVDKLAPRDTIIEAIMQTAYPTHGNELAAILNGGEDAEKHSTFRVLAKSLADGWLEQQ